MAPAILLLEDGTYFYGTGFGAPAPTLEHCVRQPVPATGGEVVFNTSMSGYHEIVTDPSYTGQIILFTSPHMGNYGCDDRWCETGTDGGTRMKTAPKAAAVVVRNLYDGPLPKGKKCFHAYLESHGISGIAGIDTRALTLALRDRGSMNGIILSLENGEPVDGWHERAHMLFDGIPCMEGRAIARETGGRQVCRRGAGGGPAVAVIDYGTKEGILKELERCGADITVFPPDSSPEEIMACSPGGVLLSNGPGDPGVLDTETAVVAGLIGRVPLFGICLGHQLLALALGGRTRKMVFGHHGGNHPVREEATGRVFVTSQNHGFEVDPRSLPEDVEISYRNANDGSVEGLRHRKLPISSVQFHPEASPGPREAAVLFDRWIASLSDHTKKTGGEE